jgi:DNA modification methylase
MMLIRGDARRLPLRDGCVACVVTSPPYWGLRDYGVADQIGLEASPDAYVAHLVAVFREVRRVLNDDGTVWLNLGDSYAGVGAQTGGTKGKERGRREARMFRPGISWSGMKQKDLVGIPWRVAFALQADGWYLRADIIWHKPNPMPESVTDRPTKAHEYLFLLAKRERYYYDAAAIAEPVSAAMLAQMEHGYDGLGLKDYAAAGVQNPSGVKARILEGAKQRMADAKVSAKPMGKHRDEKRALGLYGQEFGLTRNKRTVWQVKTQPYSGAHFATMPEALIQPCILAGCPPGGLVLDPFVGSGTVGAVAERLGRRWVGVDLTYQPLAQARTAQRGLQFAEAR